MPYDHYPTADDLSAFLTSAGFSGLDSLDLDGAIEAGIETFEQLAGRRMLPARDMGGAFVDVTMSYPGPSNGQLIFTDDFISVTSVAYSPQGQTPSTLTLDTDYRMEPANAPLLSPPRPYTAIRLLRSGGRDCGAWGREDWPYQVTGKQGYGLTLPAAAWTAMLKMGALTLGTELSYASSGGVISYTDDAGRSEKLGDSVGGALSGAWDTQANAVAKRYAKVRF